MTIENANPEIEVQNPAPQSDAPQTEVQKAPETSVEMTTEEIHNLSDDELNKKLDGEPPVPKAEKPPEDNEVEKIRKQLADKEAFIQRQANELGQLRKMTQPQPPAQQTPAPQAIPEVPQLSADELTALMLEDPRKAMQVLESERQAVEAKRQSEMAERSKVLAQLAPDLQENAAAIAKIMKEEDGLSDDVILNIAKNLDKVPQDIIYAYNVRARQAKQLAEYKAEIEKLKGKPERILSKIEAAQKPHMTSSNGQSNPLGSGSTKSASDMTDGELDEALKRSGIK